VTSSTTDRPNPGIAGRLLRWSKNGWLVAAMLAAVTFGLYAHTLMGYFIADDAHWFWAAHRALLPGASALDRINALVGLSRANQRIRVLAQATWVVDYALFGTSPVGYRVTTTIWQVAACVTVYLAISRLTKDRALGTLTAFAFAIYPVGAETVTWISVRSDSMCLCFMLLGLLAYLEWRTSRKLRWYAATLGVWALALATKETAVMFLPMIIVCDLLLAKIHERRPKALLRRAADYLPFVALLLGYFLIRSVSVGVFGEHDARSLIVQRLLTLPRSLRNTGRTLLLPINDFYVDVVPPWLALAIMVVLFLLALKRLTRSDFKLLLFGAAWVVLFMLPTGMSRRLDHLPLRFLYTSTVGYALFVTTLLRAALRNRSRAARWALALVVLALLTIFILGSIWNSLAWLESGEFLERLSLAFVDQSRGYQGNQIVRIHGADEVRNGVFYLDVPDVLQAIVETLYDANPDAFSPMPAGATPPKEFHFRWDEAAGVLIPASPQ
jgi:hypothetical protein